MKVSSFTGGLDVHGTSTTEAVLDVHPLSVDGRPVNVGEELEVSTEKQIEDGADSETCLSFSSERMADGARVGRLCGASTRNFSDSESTLRSTGTS